jgi:tRNA (guanine-N7-)-methyltransferase
MTQTPFSSSSLPPWLPSYGRRKGRGCRVKTHFTQEVEIEQKRASFIVGKRGDNIPDYPKTTPLCLEIGFGFGDHFIKKAITNPHAQWIGCEPYKDGLEHAISMACDQQCHNIYFWHDDCRYLLEQLPQARLSEVYILFPDPWPKTRHHKRRLINDYLLKKLSLHMQKGADLWIATDHDDYLRWILQHMARHPQFCWTAREPSDWSLPPQDWVTTRYQRKAEEQNKACYFLHYKHQ